MSDDLFACPSGEHLLLSPHDPCTYCAVLFQDFEDMYAECTCGHYKDTEHADGVCEVKGCGCRR